MLAQIGLPPDLSKFPENHYYHELQAFFQRNIEDGAYGPYVLVHGVPVHFDPNYTSISVDFSGGADSTILAYILCRIVQTLGVDTKVHISSISRYYDTAEFSETVKDSIYTWLKQRFPTIIGDHMWGFIPPALEFTKLDALNLKNHERRRFESAIQGNANADLLYFKQFTEWSMRRYSIAANYNGTTVNPSVSLPRSPGFRSHIDLSEKREVIGLSHVTPFSWVEKSWTTAQYDNFGVPELFEMTQSCESVRGGCGEPLICFHCAEREWSIRNKGLFIS